MLKKRSGITGTVDPKLTGTLTSTSKSILQILKDNPSGLIVSNIIKIIHLPRRTIYNNLNYLKAINLVQNIYPLWLIGGYGTVPVTVPVKPFNLHNISYILKLIYKPEWWDKRHNKFMKINNIRTLQIRNNPYHQIIKDDFLIQIFNNSMIFISQKHYWGNDPYDCFIQATQDFLETYKKVEQMFKFDFFKDGVPQVSLRSQHYVKINDILANKCKKDKLGFEVIIDNKRRIWVDMSEPFGLEAGHKDYAPEDMSRYKNLITDVIENNPPKPSELASRQDLFDKRMFDMLNLMEGIQNNQIVFDKNMKSHIKAIQGITKGINILNSKLEKISQKKLLDF